MSTTQKRSAGPLAGLKARRVGAAEIAAFQRAETPVPETAR
jgi:hypothetical protein